ncbi:MAG: ATP-binding protein [Thermomicrobiales bacterium]|nr:ATP-binding protein [Thermomicrobiales bacterium]
MTESSSSTTGNDNDMLRAMLMQAPTPFCVLSGPDHVFTLANPAYEQVSGTSDLQGKSFIEAFPDLEVQGFRELLDRVYETGEPFVGHEIAARFRRDVTGTSLTSYFNFVCQPIRDQAGAVSDLFVQVDDVTDQVLAQRALEAVLEQMPVGIVIAEAPGGRIVAANSQVQQILRHPAFPSDDIESYKQWTGVRPDGTPLRGDEWPLARALMHGEVVRGEEVRYLRGDGTMCWISLNAAPVHDADDEIISGVVAFTDVTERRELLDAEQSARREAEHSAERLRRLLAITSALDDSVTREQVGETTLRMALSTVGAIAGTIITRTEKGELVQIAALGDNNGLPTPSQPGPIIETFRTGQPVWQRLRGENGEERRGGALVTVPLVQRGKVTGVMSLKLTGASSPAGDDLDVLVGITGQAAQALERARLFDAESATRRSAEEAVRARDEFLSIASHELKTPVAALKASAQLLLRRLERGDLDQERLERACRIINDTANRLGQLTSELLDVSRLRTGFLLLQMEQLNLVDHVTEAVERFGQLSERHAISLEISNDPMFVVADAVRIDQVLSNLLDNAIKYSPDGGRIEVSVNWVDDGYLVTIHDDGIGLPQEALESIFEPFGRAPNATRGSFPGMGLGLHITRNIVLHHNGWVRAESPGEGQGSTFFVWFPANDTGWTR